MPQKREQWRLPKTFKPLPDRPDGTHPVTDGEPRLYRLVKHEKDRFLTADSFRECCDCGLTHHHTFEIGKLLNGEWYLEIRTYRVPGTGKKDEGG